MTTMMTATTTTMKKTTKQQQQQQQQQQNTNCIWMNEWILYLYTILRSEKLVGSCVWAGVYVSSYLKFNYNI